MSHTTEPDALRQRPPSIVVIIYNPDSSSGDSERNAREYAEKLASLGCKVDFRATRARAHAETLAREIADSHDRAVIVSSSGDGGYHDVINGVLASTRPNTITGLLPSGNANDHYRFLHDDGAPERIARYEARAIDVLEIATKSQTRYAHSYAGLGLTPQMAQLFNAARLNPIKEIWLVVTNLFNVRSVKIYADGAVRRYDHVVVSNIGHMSKIFTLDEHASVTDGKFELTYVKAGRVGKLIQYILRVIFKTGPKATRHISQTLTVCEATSMQLDGEVYRLEAGENLTITVRKRLLRCIV